MDLAKIAIKNVVFKSVEGESSLCTGCAFYDGEFGGYCARANEIQKCTSAHRDDRTNVIWVRAE